MAEQATARNGNLTTRSVLGLFGKPTSPYCRVSVKEPVPPVLLTNEAVKVLLLSVAVPEKLNAPPARTKAMFQVVPDMVPEAVPVSVVVLRSAQLPSWRV